MRRSAIAFAFAALTLGLTSCLVAPASPECVGATSCDECEARDGCGWCAASRSCMPGSALGPARGESCAEGGWVWSCPSFSWDLCPYYQDCATCTDEGCGFDTRTRRCLESFSGNAVTTDPRECR